MNRCKARMIIRCLNDSTGGVCCDHERTHGNGDADDLIAANERLLAALREAIGVGDALAALVAEVCWGVSKPKAAALIEHWRAARVALEGVK